MKLAKIIFLCAFCFCRPALAEEVAPKTQAENLLKALKPGEMELAVEKFADRSLIKPEFVDQIKSQVRTLLPSDKKILGYELLGEQNVGTSVKRLTYLLKTNDQPLSWTFTFYKPGAAWLPLRLVLADDHSL